MVNFEQKGLCNSDQVATKRLTKRGCCDRLLRFVAKDKKITKPNSRKGLDTGLEMAHALDSRRTESK